jgi:hypothetical protein
MRTVLAAIAVAFLLLPGCLFACGSYDGQGDRTFVRGADSMILCTNGGYAATLSTGIIEGRYTAELQTGGEVFHATAGPSGTAAFTLTAHGDGTASAPELGALAWEEVQLGKAELEYAHMQCLDVETRAWWTAPGDQGAPAQAEPST